MLRWLTFHAPVWLLLVPATNAVASGAGRADKPDLNANAALSIGGPLPTCPGLRKWSRTTSPARRRPCR